MSDETKALLPCGENGDAGRDVRGGTRASGGAPMYLPVLTPLKPVLTVGSGGL